ncbi:hypothetical protein J7K56_00220 [Candidatus Calescamantes bacterium]|nr:hypothetical protein [Candidatus Calescamantes bacterium]
MIKEWEKRDVFLKIIRREGYGIVPGVVSIVGSLWDQAPEYFEELRKRCPRIRVDPDKDPRREKEHYEEDLWGCRWHYPGGYLDGQVEGHPLENWENFKNFTPPDIEKYYNWEKEKERIEREKKEGRVAAGGIEHGFFYLRLTYLRGFTNFMFDVGERRKELYELIEMVSDFWYDVVKRFVNLGVDVIYAGDDLGHQDALPISPKDWRELIKPAYRKIFSPCREKGIDVYLHTDGYIVDIIPDLIECGVTILNPQDLVNGLDNLEKLAKGKVCIDLDIDRQKITVFRTPKEVEEHIFNCVKTLGSPEGGLMLEFHAFPGTPKENVAAVAEAMEKYYDYWVKK